MHLAQFIPLLIFVIFTSSVVRPSQKLVRQCSFTDEMSNFYASWHTNCSGLVSFVINAFNFPRPKVPFANGLSDFSPYSHFWIGIGIRLVSTELIVVESQPNGAVLVSQARIEPNRPPQRQIGQGILLNPRGSFFGTTLEATFSIDESLLRGCKEFLFYTTPMPLDIPFANLPPPHIREICELGQMCAISACSPGKEEALTKQQKRSVAFGDGFSGPVGLMDFIGTGSPQDPTIPMTMMNDIGTMNRGKSLPNQQQLQFVVAIAALNLSKNASKNELTNLTDQSENPPMVTVMPKISNGTVAKPASTVQNFTENRSKRQTTGQMFDDFAHEHGSTLKGTAYEGQDNQFHRMEPVISALNPQYEALARYQAQHGLGQMPGQPMDRPAGTYWPYRTMVGTADVQGAPQQQQGAQMVGNGEVMMSSSPSGWAGEPPLMEPPASAQNFYVPEKCDFGTDPQWCGDYVQQYVKWFEQYGSRGKPICLSLMDSLKNSDHRCCNALQTLNC